MKRYAFISLFFAALACGANAQVPSPWVPVYAASLLSGDITAAATAFLIIDLDDTTSFPHDSSTSAEVRQLIISASSSGDFDVMVGPVTAANVTSGTACCLIATHVTSATGGVNVVIPIDPYLRIDTATIATASANNLNDKHYLATGHGGLTDVAGNTTKSAAVGDWIIWVIERVSGTLNLNATIIYSTE